MKEGEERKGRVGEGKVTTTNPNARKYIQTERRLEQVRDSVIVWVHFMSLSKDR